MEPLEYCEYYPEGKWNRGYGLKMREDKQDIILGGVPCEEGLIQGFKLIALIKEAGIIYEPPWWRKMLRPIVRLYCRLT